MLLIPESYYLEAVGESTLMATQGAPLLVPFRAAPSGSSGSVSGASAVLGQLQFTFPSVGEMGGLPPSLTVCLADVESLSEPERFVISPYNVALYWPAVGLANTGNYSVRVNGNGKHH